MKISHILLYESKNTEDFYPFSIMHPIWELRVGAFRIFEKYQVLFPESEFHFFGRKEHSDSFYSRFNKKYCEISDGNLLSLDCSLLPITEFIDEILDLIKSNDGQSIIFTVQNKPVGIYLNENDLDRTEEFKRQELLSDLDVNLFSKFKKIELSKFVKLNYLFDAIYVNADSIRDDAEILRLHKSLANPKDYPAAHFINPDNILLGKNVNIHPGSVLDASDGAIILDDNATIMAQSTILGPCYIGKNSIIKIGAKIYHDNSFGEWCKVGGEIENSIIQSYSNKQHEGFLGHSFISEWVNLGADTNTSDLKNTYSNVKIRIEDREIDTEKMFLGLLCGDHTKSGINTMFTTGTVAGICGILVREWFLPNFIKSFSWGGANNSPAYKVNSAIETVKIVMKRRNRELTPEEEKLIRIEYANVISKS